MPSTSEAEPASLLDRAVSGDIRATAKLISLVEAGGPHERAVAREAFPSTGRAWILGITGLPGAGKSTLADRLVAGRRAHGERVAVVAVDPSSPFSGGAILGDRLRMQDHALDPGVFVRSMATRGQAGGLARATLGAVRVLDAAGWPEVVVETVGAGQVEVDVARAADTVVVVVNPGWGDSVQAAKAGLLEIADVLVVNKADRPGADEAVRDLEAMLDLADRGVQATQAGPEREWRPPVVRTTATAGDGVADLAAAVARHRAFMSEGDRLHHRRAAQLEAEVQRLVEEAGARAARRLCAGPAYTELLAAVDDRRLDPLAAADQVVGGVAVVPGSMDSDRPQPLQ